MIPSKNYEFNENQIHKYLRNTKKALTNPKSKLCSKQPPNKPQEPKETPHEPNKKTPQINTNISSIILQIQEVRARTRSKLFKISTY